MGRHTDRFGLRLARSGPIGRPMSSAVDLLDLPAPGLKSAISLHSLLAVCFVCMDSMADGLPFSTYSVYLSEKTIKIAKYLS